MKAEKGFRVGVRITISNPEPAGGAETTLIISFKAIGDRPLGNSIGAL